MDVMEMGILNSLQRIDNDTPLFYTDSRNWITLGRKETFEADFHLL